MRHVASALTLILLITASTLAQNAQTPQTPTLPGGVIYVEHPEGGPSAATGRSIPSSGGVIVHGLDINSGVEVNIDPSKLAQALAAQGIGKYSPQQKQLVDRIVTLTNLMAEIETAGREEQRLIDLFSSGTADEFRAARRASSGRILRMRNTLSRAVAQRLTSEGTAENDSGRRAKVEIGTLGLGVNDWPAFGDLVARELNAAQRAFDATAPNSGISLELQAHLIPLKGEPSAIPLPGHNSVKPGPISRYEKIRFEVPADQEQIFKDMEELAKKTDDAKNVGEALLTALRSDVAASPFQAQLEKVKADAEQVKVLASAIDSKSIDAFLKAIKDKAVTNNASDSQLIKDLTKLVDESKREKTMFAALTNVNAFTDSLKNADPVSAMNQILGRFKAATTVPTELESLKGQLQTLAKDVQSVRTSLDAANLTPAIKSLLEADDSPFGQLLKPDSGLPLLIRDTERLGEMIITFFHAETTATAVADLPVPEGQKRIPVEQNASTSFNLQTIPVPRNPGDTVRLSYAFYSGDEAVASSTWADTFNLRLYGLSDKVTASLALVRQTSQSKFKPTAALSWLLMFNSWPTTANDTPRAGIRIFSGAGLTTMALDFDPNETAELGIAPTLSFINDKLLIGFGWDLQAAKKRTYAFFSFHLLSRSGFLSGASSAPPAK
jgi:hypothetical protein